MSHIILATIESAIYSGILREFDDDTRMKLIEIYEEVKLSNEIHLKYYDMLLVQVKTDDTKVKMLFDYYSKLNAKRLFLTDLIPTVIEKLRIYER